MDDAIFNALGGVGIILGDVDDDITQIGSRLRHPENPHLHGHGVFWPLGTRIGNNLAHLGVNFVLVVTRSL
ncbi:MAG TPA: hypothetical protein VHB98_19190, partial [Chloroflexota bacterium]|nr:hypothetical protein [Chloroflexota bacterium]